MTKISQKSRKSNAFVQGGRESPHTHIGHFRPALTLIPKSVKRPPPIDFPSGASRRHREHFFPKANTLPNLQKGVR